MAKPLKSDLPNAPNVQFSHFGVLNDGSQSRGSLFTSIVLNILIGITAIVVGATARKGVNSHVFLKLAKALGIHVSQALVASIALSLGWLAHNFKKRWQYYYGVTEMWFAAISAWNLARGLSTQEALLSRWVALVASAYIAARGLGNIAEAKKKIAVSISATESSTSNDTPVSPNTPPLTDESAVPSS